MATHIQLHRSNVAGATPSVSTMLEGEVAVNLQDKKLFVKGADGSLITLVDAHTSHDAAGSVGGIQFKDSGGFSGDTGKFVFDSANTRVGIGTGSPREALEVQGTMQSTGVSADGATFGVKGFTTSGPIFVNNAPVTIKGAGDVTLNLIADSDNSGENDNPIISMGQDGAEARFDLGVVGDAGQIFTNSLANAAFLDTANSNNDLQFSVGGDMKMTLLDTGKVGVGTKAPREKLEVSGTIQATGVSADGATFGVKGITVDGGGKFAGGVTAASIDVSGNITGSASSLITAGAFFGPLVGNATTASSAGSATIATTATNVSVQGKSDNTEYRVVFAESAGSGTTSLGAKVDSGAGDAGLLFNPAKDTLTTGIIHAGVSADGATFGGDIRCQSNIILGEDGFIGTADDDERIKFDGSGNILSFRTPNVQIERKLAHYGDGDTFLDFTPDNLEIQVGGKVFAEAKGADGLLHAPFGISGGGATFDNHVGFLAGATVGGDCKVDGTLLIAQQITHAGDSDTGIDFATNQVTIRTGTEGEPQIKATTGHKVELGDVEEANSGTRVIIDDANTKIQLISNSIEVGQDIVHSGDSNTKITYGADSITLTAGGTNYQAITTAGTNFADTDVVRPNLKDYSETVNAIGTITGNTAIDFSAGNVQTVTGNGNCEFSFTNPPASGKSGTLTLLITNGGANTTTWHSSVKWPSDVAPSLTSSGIDIVSFVTIDGGTNIYGFVGGLNFS